MDQSEVQAARDKLAARFGNVTQIGGKGKFYKIISVYYSILCERNRYITCDIGTQRRKKKHVTVQNVNEDKKLKSAIKKFGKWCLNFP